MLVRIFKSTQFYPVALIVLFSIVINLAFGFFRGPQLAPNGTLFFQTLTNWAVGINHWWISLIVFILLTSQALHLNYVLNYHEIFFKQSWLPALFYLIFSTQVPEFVQLSPLLIINTLFVFVIDKVFSLYKNKKAMGATFDAALLLAIISLIYAPAVFFIPLFFIGVAILKSISWRDLSIGVIGIIVPFLLVLVVSFLNGHLLEFTNQYKNSFTSAPALVNYNFPKYILTMLVIVSLFVLALLKLRSNYLKNVTKSRLCQQILLLFIILGLTMISFSATSWMQNYMVLVIPFSSIVAYYFLDGKKIFYQELILWILIANWTYANFFI
jgi:hypothetical protein